MSTYIKNLGLASILTMGLVRASDMSLGFDSLASLAEMDTDEIKSLDSRLFPAGLFAVRCTEVALGVSEKEGTNPETGEPYEPLYSVTMKYEVLEAKPLDKDLAQNPEALMGRVLTQRRTFWPKSFKEEIGLVKGDYEKVGLEPIGKLGGMEGGEPGWLNQLVDHVFALKVSHSKPNAEGTQFVNIHWQKNKKPAAESEAA